MTNEEFLEALKDIVKRAEADPGYLKYIVDDIGDDVEALIEEFDEFDEEE